MGEIEIRRILCQNGTGGCYLCCGLLVHIDRETGRIVNVEGNPDHPVNRGRICDDRKRVPNFLARWLYHSDQLLHPLKRTGKRGENKWLQIPYEQALDEISAKLKETVKTYGPECLAVAEGTFRADCYWARARFLNLLGNPGNVVDPGTICGRVLLHLNHVVAGSVAMPGNISASNCLVIIGKNVPECMPPLWWDILRRKRKGNLKIIVFDPRFTETVRNADIWLQLRPGTDNAVLLSWMYTIIKEGLYDLDFVEKWTNAPFLVRADTGKLLTELDLVAGGDPKKFVVWDSISKSPKMWNPQARQYEPEDVRPILKGVFEVKLAGGETVECKTVWQLLTERVEEYPPERVEEISWVPKEKILESARTYATMKPAAFIWGVSPDQFGRNAIRLDQSRCILRGITGNVDVVGGDQLIEVIGPWKNGNLFIRESTLELTDKLPKEQRRKQLGCDRFRLITWPGYELCDAEYRKMWGIPLNVSGHGMLTPAPLLWRTILSSKPYPIKALITWGANPLVWAPNTKLVYEALKSSNLELHVVIDHFMTPTAQLADYVLPAASKSLESPFLSNWEDMFPHVIIGEKAVKPLGERRPDYEFWRELAVKFGFGEYFPWKTAEEVADYRLKPLGLTLSEGAKQGMIFHTPEVKPESIGFGTAGAVERGYAQIEPKTGKPVGFGTPSGKLELYPFILEELGYDPLPFYDEPPESPVSTPMVAREYPLILTTGGRVRPLFHSEYRQWGTGLREQHPYPCVEINYLTARERGIVEGDWVWIETRRGRIVQKAKLSAGIHPSVVNVEASWWYPELPAEEPWLHGVWISNANVLTLDEIDSLDPLTGGWCNRALLCKVYKAKETEIPAQLVSIAGRS